MHLVHSDCAAETFLDGVVICYQYSDLVEELVKQVKYQFASAIITDIVRLMETYWSAYQIEIDTLCGVPLSTRKLRWRGFNQSELMARQLAFALGKPFNELLTRNVNTKTQVGQSRVSRLENLHNVFAPKVTPISGNVLIVDDVMTTGSTLEQCAKVLKESGAAKVYGFAFARG